MKKFIFSLLGMLCAVPAFAQVTTTGTGTVYAKPDCAHVSFTARSENAAAAAAHRDNRKLTESLWAVFKNHKIADADVASGWFSLHRSFDKDGKQTGFAAFHQITITLRNPNDLGSLIDDAVTAGAELNGISFQVKDKDALEKQARDKAIADAKAKAQQLVAGLGTRLGNVKSVNESGGYYPRFESAYRMAAVSDGPAGVPSKVGAGQTAITVIVSVTWDVDCSK